MKYYKTTAENSSKNHNFKLIPTLIELSKYLGKYKFRVIVTALCLIAAKAATISIPLITKPIYDSLDSSLNDVVVLPLTLLIAFGLFRFASSLFNEIRTLIFTTVSLPSIREINTKVFYRLARMPLSYHLERRTGGVSRDIERGSRAINSLLYTVAISIIPTILELGVVMVILAIKYHIKYLIVMVISIIIYGIFTYFTSMWRIKFRAAVNSKDSQANSVAIDALLNYETVKYFNNETYEKKRYFDQLGDWVSSFYKSEGSLALLNSGQALIIALSLTSMMIMAASDVQLGIITIGDFALINGFLLQIFIPLNILGFVFRNIQTSLVDVNSMLSLLEQKVEDEEEDSSQQPKATKPLFKLSKGQIDIKNIEFHYQNNRQILKGLNLSISAGQKVAIVGESGSGKSTMARLLYRFYEPQEGQIIIDNQIIRDHDINSVRQQIGVVPQDVVLFNDTIEYNILYGNTSSTKDDVINAAKLAYLHDFIESLPDKYQTVVGERGLKLSGGEKQRIAIARAILKNPQILILDEATSSLDSHSENQIQHALNELAKDRTSIIIAHRLSTIKDVDNIFVLDKGELIESGSHDTLLEKNGHYAKLWKLQSSNH